jgi:hypothetical protein
VAEHQGATPARASLVPGRFAGLMFSGDPGWTWRRSGRCVPRRGDRRRRPERSAAFWIFAEFGAGRQPGEPSGDPSSRSWPRGDAYIAKAACSTRSSATRSCRRPVRAGSQFERFAGASAHLKPP